MTKIQNFIKRALLLLRHLPLTNQLIISGILVGVAAGLSAYIFEILIQIVMKFGFERMGALPDLRHKPEIIYLPAIGGLICGLVTNFICPEAHGHGVMEVIEAIEKQNGKIKSKVVWAKTIASAATIGTGGSAGKEGPIIQIGAAVGSFVGRSLFQVTTLDLKTLVAGGAVGGISAAFGVPLSGVFFTMEVILKDFANEAFPSVVIASVTGCMVARALLGDMGYFTPVNYQCTRPQDLFWFALLGIACAPLGLFYMGSLKTFEHFFKRMHFLPNWLKPAIGGLLLGLLAWNWPQLLGPGQDTINQAITGQLLGYGLIILVIGKTLATSVTLGSGGSGGMLIPALYVGAVFGNLWGNILQTWNKVAMPAGSFAVVGMSCIFNAAFNAPLTAILLTFELTRDYGLMMPVMLACIMTSIFTHKKPPELQTTKPTV